jgi:hypothetical protein
MLYPYAEFLLDFDRKYGDMAHQNCPENTRAAVMVETRPNFFVPKVIRNVMHFLGPRWNLHVVCSEPSYLFLREALAGWEVGLIKRSGLPVKLPRRDYRAMKISTGFWKTFREDKILVFEVDSLLSGSNVEDFIDYDYVGAPCARFDDGYIANGGLSLRTREVMIDCLERFTPGPNVPEDVFFTESARALGAAMPDFETATHFSVESIYTSHPVGVHGTDKYYHGVDVAEKITAAISY